MSKVILVTGANTGIGFELVRLLAEKKHIVYLAARNESLGKEAQAKLHADGLDTVKYVHLDVTDLATIQVAKETISQAEGRLDVLVNNAAIGKLDENQNATSVSLTPIRETMETNFFWTRPNYHSFPPFVTQIVEWCHIECLHGDGIQHDPSRPECLFSLGRIQYKQGSRPLIYYCFGTGTKARGHQSERSFAWICNYPVKLLPSWWQNAKGWCRGTLALGIIG